jgi:hypothetical protein
MNAGKSIHGTSSTSAQASAHDTKQQIKSFSGHSRSNQPDHAIAQVDELVNPAKDELNTDGVRADSSNKLSSKSQAKHVDSSSPMGDTAGQALIGTPTAAPIGVGKSIRGTSSTSAQAAAHDAKQQIKSFSGRSRSSQPDHAMAQVDELVNPAKEELNTDGESSPNTLSKKSPAKHIDFSSSLGDTAGQALIGTPIAAPIGAGKSIHGTSSTGAQAAAPDAKQQIKSFSGRSRSNQPDHAMAQVDELVNPAKEELNTGGESSPNKLSKKSRAKHIDSSSSLGDTAGQAPIGTSITSPVTPAGTGKASGADADAIYRDRIDLGKPTKRRTTYPSGSKPSTPVLSSSGPSVHLVDSAKSSFASAQAAAAAEARHRVIAEAGNIREGGLDTAPSGVVRSEDQDRMALPKRLPNLPNSWSNTRNSLPPAEYIESQEQDLSSVEDVDGSDGDSSDEYGEDDDIYEDARAISEKLAIPGFKEAHQQEARRQMHMQQQQLPEVAHALESKPPGSRSTTTVLGIGVGGSRDKPQSSKEKSPRRNTVEPEYLLQQANGPALNLDHQYRKLWNRANLQSEELQKSQHQNDRLLDDNRSLTHELEAVKVQLADARKLSEVLMVLAAGKMISEAGIKELKVDTTDVDQKTDEETSDMPGGSDILLTAAAIQMVDVLNMEVRRVVAVLGKVLQKTKFAEGRRQIMQITEKARLMLGESMVALLSAGLPEQARLDPLLVEVVLQVAITNWCKTTISSWKPGNNDVSNLLVELYSKIREVGKSASTFINNPP